MKYKLRTYQQEASDIGFNCLVNTNNNGVIVASTGSGKSLIIGDISIRLSGIAAKVLVIQSSKEILAQNYEKFTSYGYTAGIYSASHGRKDIDNVTFSTIGSIYKKSDLFKDVKYVIIDECHLVGNDANMYQTFFEHSEKLGSPKRILGLTATPYRLSTDGFGGSILKLITRTRPKIFDKIIWYNQTKDLVDSGFLMPITYYELNCVKRQSLRLNSTGADYTDESLKRHYDEIGYNRLIVKAAKRLLEIRPNLVIFVKFVKDAEWISQQIDDSVVVSAETPKKERDKILSDLKSGNIKCVVNCEVLSIGFDFPSLSTIIYAKSTRSLARWIQAVGRLSRKADGKIDAWCVDMGGNKQLFGDINDIRFEEDYRGGKHYFSGLINGKRKQLTNVYFDR